MFRKLDAVLARLDRRANHSIAPWLVLLAIPFAGIAIYGCGGGTKTVTVASGGIEVPASEVTEVDSKIEKVGRIVTVDLGEWKENIDAAEINKANEACEYGIEAAIPVSPQAGEFSGWTKKIVFVCNVDPHAGS